MNEKPMAEVKDVMNDVYLAYKKYKATGDLKQWNGEMGALAGKYQGDYFYGNLAITFAARVSQELGH